jgi:hypothetical protein
MTLDALQRIIGIPENVTQTISNNPIASTAAAVVGGATLAGGVALAVSAVKKRKKSKSKRKNSRKKSTRSKRKRGRRTPRTAGKGRDRSRKRIRYTKNGQPYVIMASGKARFISKRGAKISKKRKGGRY